MYLVVAMRRALFWLLPQLDRFHACSIELAEEQLRVLEELASAYDRLDGALGRALAEFARRQGELQRELDELRAELQRRGDCGSTQGTVAGK
jgi:predicted transcriptional regulator